jgi:hypothetical protein
MKKPIEAMTTSALREHVEWAEAQADLAQFIDDWPRAQREQRYWLAIAKQIRDEIERRRGRQGAA